MYISCKCLNIILKSSNNNLPTSLVASNNTEDDVHQLQSIAPPNEQPFAQLRSSTVQKLNGNHLMFFKTVSSHYNYSHFGRLFFSILFLVFSFINICTQKPFSFFLSSKDICFLYVCLFFFGICCIDFFFHSKLW